MNSWKSIQQLLRYFYLDQSGILTNRPILITCAMLPARLKSCSVYFQICKAECKSNMISLWMQFKWTSITQLELLETLFFILLNCIFACLGFYLGKVWAAPHSTSAPVPLTHYSHYTAVMCTQFRPVLLPHNKLKHIQLAGVFIIEPIIAKLVGIGPIQISTTNYYTKSSCKIWNHIFSHICCSVRSHRWKHKCHHTFPLSAYYSTWKLQKEQSQGLLD